MPGLRVLARAPTHRRLHMQLSLRPVLGVAGTALLGGALVWAPVAAFTGDMLTVTKAGLAGVALLIVMKLLPRHTVTPEHQSDPVDHER